jgi:magnesium chelatase subunit H
MKITVFYVGSSLLAPLKHAERDINREHGVDLSVTTYNFGSPLIDDEWEKIERDLSDSDIVFVIHVMDGENAARLMPALERHRSRHRAVIVINCMPELMKRTRMGRLDFAALSGIGSRKGAKAQSGKSTKAEGEGEKATSLLGSIGSWIGNQARSRTAGNGHGRANYLKYVDRLPSLLRLLPNAGRLRDVKNYLYLVCYFLQPTPANIRSMILHALKHYVPDPRLERIKVPKPEAMPSVAIYHPDAPQLFESFEAYRKWYSKRSFMFQGSSSKAKDQRPKTGDVILDPKSTIGLLLMRPQIVSNTRKHYDGLIRAIEAEGLSVIPAISTLMDNRQACEKFFIEPSKAQRPKSNVQSKSQKKSKSQTTDNEPLTTDSASRSRVSQIVSLTGFSFVGGPAMNDSEAAAEFLTDLNVPFRSMVSLDTQTIDSWRESFTGLNPVQTGMQVAIPEIDGATEPFVFGGIPERGVEPAPLDDRCRRIARRLSRWNRLQTAPRDQLKVALVLYCFPPNKGNIGTAADLDVFASLFDILVQLKNQGYRVTVPDSAHTLRDMLLGGNSEQLGATTNVAHRMSVEDYRRVCPFVSEIENEWGPAPGSINSFGGHLLIQGLTLGNVFIGVQPTFGYEDDPMRLLMAKGGTPHHGFAAFHTYLESVFQADAVVHVGTHGAMEFMPGKQVGLSSECWPDRLIGELPNLYIYSVNNPSEGTIAKRRSYAELISYLTPPIENAGLYKGLASLKDSIMAYRQATDEDERQELFSVIEEARRDLNLGL